jgi:NitT/TauT family transport system ATP-binding protein
LFSPHPGRIQEEFVIELSRPRELNNTELAGYAGRIMASLRKFIQPEELAAK